METPLETPIIGPHSDRVNRLKTQADASDSAGLLLGAQELVTVLNRELNITAPGVEDQEEKDFQRSRDRRAQLDKRLMRPSSGEKPREVVVPGFEGVL
jgi:hypothetical protein